MKKHSLLVLTEDEMIDAIALQCAKRVSNVQETAALIKTGKIFSMFPSIALTSSDEKLLLFAREEYAENVIGDASALGVEIDGNIHVVYVKEDDRPLSECAREQSCDPTDFGTHIISYAGKAGKDSFNVYICKSLRGGGIFFMGARLEWVDNLKAALPLSSVEAAKKWWKNYLLVKNAKLKEIGEDKNGFKVYVTNLADDFFVVRIRDFVHWYNCLGHWCESTSRAVKPVPTHFSSEQNAVKSWRDNVANDTQTEKHSWIKWGKRYSGL